MKRFAPYCYEPLLAIPAALAILLAGHAELGLPSPTLAAILYTILVCLVCAVYRMLRGRDRLLLLGASAILLLIPALYGLREASADYHYTHRYLWLIPLLALGCHLCAALSRNIRTVRYLAALGIVAFLVFCLIRDIELSRGSVLFFLTTLLLLFADETQTLWRKSGHTDHTKHLTFIAPFVVIWLGLMLLMPVSDSPYDWQVFKTIWHRIQDLTISLRQKTGGTDDLYAYKIGFSDESSTFAGDLEYSNKILFDIERVSGTRTPAVYLAGQYCDTLDGLAWTATVTADDEENNFDVLETQCAFNRESQSGDYLKFLDLRITFRDFASSYLIAPDKTRITKAQRDLLNLTTHGRNIQFDEKQGINTEYVVYGFRLNTLHEVFLDYMKTLEPITEDYWIGTLGYYRGSMDDFTYERLLTYRQQMYDRYVHEISLPASAREFLEAAVGDSDNAFERMMRIQQRLSGFTYTPKPGNLPDTVTDGASFLEYFLSERRGYCSHYATAMTLFAWAEGLPARYVYGFHVPFAEEDNATVTAAHAHAWCEIYFENVGWIPFDATPGHTDGSFWAVYSEMDKNAWAPVAMPSVSATPTPAPETSTETPSGSRLRLFLYLLLGIAAILVFAIPVLLLDRLYHVRRFRRMSAAEQIRVLYRRNTKILNYLELPSGEDETLAEYRARLERFLPHSTVRWLDSYETYLYGANVDPQKVAVAMLRGNRELIEEFRGQAPGLYRLCNLTNRLL